MNMKIFNCDCFFSLQFLPMENCYESNTWLPCILQTIPETRPEVSLDHLNGFLKLLGKSTQNEIGSSTPSQNATRVENATKPHSAMKIGGQIASKFQVQGPAVHKDTGCWQCGEPFQNLTDLLFCDWCDREFHSRCVLVGLQPLPETNWVCPLCEGGR